ncbi:short coiled-coil protein B [Exaiptasia diaphana]|uniref:Short coiled-coil protein n=1 Tax=Exaiptasia diaphana TaxID=2652724 RepID=A0A913XEK4_EXADI|nr:short coiled-coil protein B [Exaiptasia diaphana]KXJ12571.1 Short coiled-coil protein [Exaiptasia diaphana]
MSGNENENKPDMKMVSIPLSSDDEITNGGNLRGSQTLKTDKVPDEILDENEVEEKNRLINEVLELQNTLDDLSQRVDAVKDENLKLKSENQVLGQYIENLMSASSVFQPTSTGGKKRQSSGKTTPKRGDKR